MLNQDAMTPLYVQLMDEVEQAINNGIYKPGDRIMTEAEMAKKYGVSLITVRKAIGSLMEKGLVIRKQGKGTFVTKPKFSKNMKKLQGFSDMCEQMGVKPGAKVLESRLINADEKTAARLGIAPGSKVNMKKLQGFSDMCEQMGVKPGAKVLESRLINADEKTAARLGIAPGSKVVYISRLRTADNEPVQIERSCFPLKYAFLLETDLNDSSLFQVLEEKSGNRVASSEKTIELCRATAEEAALLDVGKTDYLLFVRSTAYDQNEVPLYTGVQLINGDRFSLYVYESDRE